MQQLFKSNGQSANKSAEKVASFDELYEPEASFITRISKQSIGLVPLPSSNSLLAKGSIQGIQLLNKMIQRLNKSKRQA
ncbi:MAG: hypothetical protein AB8W37_02395 [Arsenophonus endosymbiont of Dermacentor nuttalli]